MTTAVLMDPLGYIHCTPYQVAILQATQTACCAFVWECWAGMLLAWPPIAPLIKLLYAGNSFNFLLLFRCCCSSLLQLSQLHPGHTNPPVQQRRLRRRSATCHFSSTTITNCLPLAPAQDMLRHTIQNPPSHHRHRNAAAATAAQLRWVGFKSATPLPLTFTSHRGLGRKA